MISTVTTSTVSTITTITGGSITLIGIMVLLTLLAQKEVTASSTSKRVQKLRQAVNIGIIPLLIAFMITIAVKAMEVLN
jgi:hypothetical protein